MLADQCPHCHGAVTGVAQVAVQSYDRIEIPEITPEVTRVTLHGGVCPCCARRFKAPPPAGLEPGSPFGPNLRAVVLYLRFGQAIPFERLERLMRDLFGLEISEGALVNLLEDSAPAFEVQTSRIKERLLSGAALASDETSVRVGKTTFWTWVFHHADSAYFVIRPSRGKAVVREFLGEFRPEFWISDRLAAQMGWASKDHQVCLAHLLRDIQYAIDAGDDAFAPGMKALLKRAARIGRRRPALADPPWPPTIPGSRPGSTNCSRSCRTPRRDKNSSGSSSASGRTCSSSSPTATFRPRTTAPSRPCDPASSSERSPTASDPSGAPNSTPTSDPSLKPRDEDRSARFRPSASPSTACRYPWPRNLKHCQG